MPEWLLIVLLLVFVIHLLVFGRLALKRGGAYYWLVSSVFAALVLSFSSRLWASEWMLAGLPAHQLFRYVAWALAAVTIPWLIYRITQKKR